MLKVTASNPVPVQQSNGTWSLEGAAFITGDFTRFGNSASQYQYRQYIKGRTGFDIGGTIYPGPSIYVYGGGTISNNYQEDGCNKGANRYGHRSETGACGPFVGPPENYYDDSNHTQVDRAAGPYYSGGDNPGISGFSTPPSSVKVLIDFHFMGQVVKVNADGSETVICAIYWDIYYYNTVPAS